VGKYSANGWYSKSIRIISYQYIGDHMLKQLIKSNYPLSKVKASNSGTDLTHEECNAVQYAVGYVVMKLKKR